jgi:hypothetical protein
VGARGLQTGRPWLGIKLPNLRAWVGEGNLEERVNGPMKSQASTKFPACPALLPWAMAVLLCLGYSFDGTAAEPASSAVHWSLQPVRRVEVQAGVHPVDAFVQQALKAQGLSANPPASPRDLVRRVYFDLIGLPPSPAEVEAYLADPATDRYEKLVERLLASPRYGERWARHWLDVVRYTESQGFEYDRFRDHAWHYRDYVIRSFNADKPYDRFMREQIAGDVMEPVTSEGIIAAGLLVAGPWDQAGNAQANQTQRAITREEEMEDLVSVVGQTFLGLTVNCARCHDHKFDPIPLADYYRVKAVFDGVRHGDRSVESAADKADREARLATARKGLADAEASVSELERAVVMRVAAGRGTENREPGPSPAFLWNFAAKETGAAPGQTHGGARLVEGGLELPSEGAYFEAPVLARDVREKTLEAWVRLADLKQGGGAVISLEKKGGGLFDAIVFGERQSGKWMAGSEGFARTRDVEAPAEDAPAGAWVHVAAVYASDGTVALFRNGEPYGQPYKPGSGLQTFKAGEARVVIGRRHEGGTRAWLTGAVRQAALHERALSPAEVKRTFQSGGVAVSTAEMIAALTPEERLEREARRKRVASAQEMVQRVSKAGPVAYVGTRVQPEPTRVLKRGDVKSPGDVAVPAGLRAVGSIPSDLGLAAEAPEAQRRLKFAEWLAHPSNPLPARVMVNRLWHFHFGQGLVATPSDLGRSGTAPSHPELLDWLASEFVSGGWSVKSIHRWIVTSAAYRQSADARPEALRVDADNRWLWRFSPRRLEAEAVRDAMLAVSGEINLQMGGPSFRPFTTSDYGATFYHLFDKGEPEFNRRTVYRMNINSGKDPLLDAFDCPDPSVKTPRRGVTTTPLQALGLMNSSFVQRQAAALAVRAGGLAGTGAQPGAVVDAAYRLALGRPPSAMELQAAETAARERGVANVCWALLNSTEFVYVR